MRKNGFQKLISFILVIMLLFSISPVPTFAADLNDNHNFDGTEILLEIEETTEVTEETVLETTVAIVENEDYTEKDEISSALGEDVLQAVEAINTVVLRYFGTLSITEDEVPDFVLNMEDDVFFTALIDTEDTNYLLQDILDFDSLTDEELEFLTGNASVYESFWASLLNRAESEQMFGTYATTGSIDGLSISGTASAGTATVTTGTGTFTLSATSPSKVSATAGKSTFTIQNTSGSTIVVSFDYTVNNQTSYSITGVDSDEANKCTVKLVNQAKFTIVLNVAGKNLFGTNTANFVASNLLVETVLDSAQLSIDYNDAFGEIKDDAGNIIGANSPVTVPLAGLTVIAEPKADYQFVAWVEPSTNKFISFSPERMFSPTVATLTAKAIFSDGTPWFIVNGDTLVEGWDAAIAYGGTVVLANNATLSKRDEPYNIPAGVDLLIPFSTANIGTFGAIPEDASLVGSATPSAFRTLTVESGATITVDGRLNVNGQRNVSSQGTTGTGTAKGKHGLIDLQGSGTQLTVNSTGVLTCYGFIKGTGGVTLNGGDLHELMQVYDWGGGSNLSGWYTNLGSKKAQTLFFTSHYYVQNVEAPLTVKYGSDVLVEAALTVSGTLIRSSAKIISYDSGDGLFLLGSGTELVRTYDAYTDRVEYHLKGAGTVNFGSLKVSVKVIFNVDLDSSEFTLPLNNALTIRIGSGVNMNMGNRAALMPGAQVIVDEGGTLNLTNHLYIFDKDDKTSSLFFAQQLAPKYTAGRGTTAKITAITDSARLEINGTLNMTGNGAVYTTIGGSNTDKIVYGTGTINHKGTLGAGTLRGGYTSNYVTVSVGNGLANLAGVGDLQPLSSDTTNGIVYRGLGSDHNNYWYINSAEVAATCGDNAYTKYYCTDENSYYRIEKTGTATGNHTYDNGDVFEPSCETAGYTTYTCTTCGDTKTESVAATGHSYTSKVTAPTCTEKGYTTYTCACGDSYTADEVAAKGHTEVVDAAVAATCTTPGKTEGKHCSVCNEVLVAQETVDALGHSYDDGVVTSAPTCTAAGVKTYTCATCGDSYTEEIPAAGHTVDSDNICTVCGEKVEVESLAKLEALAVSADAEVLLIMRISISQELLNDKDAKVIVTEEKNSRAEKKVTEYTMAQVQELEIDAKGRYAFKTGIASGEMTGEVTLQIKDGSDNYVYIADYKSDKVTTSVTRTVTDYIRLALATDSDAYAGLRNLMTHLAVYGGYAQIYFNTHPDDLAYDVLGDTNIAAVDENNITGLSISGSDIGIQYDSRRIGLDSSIYISNLFFLTGDDSIDKYTFTLTYTEGGITKTKSLTPVENTDTDVGGYRVVIENIPAAYLDYMYTITVTKTNAADTQAEGTEAEAAEAYVVKTSVTAYVKECITTYGNSTNEEAVKLVNLVKAMYLYNQAANEYFGK